MALTLKLLGIGLAVGAGIGYYLLVDRPAATRRRSETPALELAYREHQSEGLVILGIDSAEQDILKEAQAFADEFNVTYPLLWDTTDEVLEAYGVLGLPTSVFLVAKGRVQRVYVGGMSEVKIHAFIGEIIE